MMDLIKLATGNAEPDVKIKYKNTGNTSQKSPSQLGQQIKKNKIKNYLFDIAQDYLAPIGQGAIQALTLGRGDEIGAGLQSILGRNYDEALAENRTLDKQIAAENPALTFAGNAAASILLGGSLIKTAGAGLGGLSSAANAILPSTTAGILGRGAALGAAQASGESEADFATQDYFGDAITGGLIGGAAAGLLPAGQSIYRGLVKPIVAPTVTAASRAAQSFSRGILPENVTPSQSQSAIEALQRGGGLLETPLNTVERLAAGTDLPLARALQGERAVASAAAELGFMPIETTRRGVMTGLISDTGLPLSSLMEEAGHALQMGGKGIVQDAKQATNDAYSVLRSKSDPNQFAAKRIIKNYEPTFLSPKDKDLFIKEINSELPKGNLKLADLEKIKTKFSNKAFEMSPDVNRQAKAEYTKLAGELNDQIDGIYANQLGDTGLLEKAKAARIYQGNVETLVDDHLGDLDKRPAEAAVKFFNGLNAGKSDVNALRQFWGKIDNQQKDIVKGYWLGKHIKNDALDYNGLTRDFQKMPKPIRDIFFGDTLAAAKVNRVAEIAGQVQKATQRIADTKTPMTRAGAERDITTQIINAKAGNSTLGLLLRRVFDGAQDFVTLKPQIDRLVAFAYNDPEFAAQLLAKGNKETVDRIANAFNKSPVKLGLTATASQQSGGLAASQYEPVNLDAVDFSQFVQPTQANLTQQSSLDNVDFSGFIGGQ